MICAVSPDIMGPIDPTQGPSSDSACGRQICLEHEGRVAQCIVGDVWVSIEVKRVDPLGDSAFSSSHPFFPL